jgi:hypothetical protein
MTEADFFTWMASYKIRFLGPGENYDFVLTWKPDILKLDLADAMEAIADVGRSAIPQAHFPRQHLPLIIDFAEERAHRRSKWQDPLAGQRPTVPTTRWNRWMLEHGVITKNEFNRRERAKEGV